METIKGAKLMITVLIDNDKVEEMRSKGYSEKDIEKAIKKAITLTEYKQRGVVTDIEDIELVKYY